MITILKSPFKVTPAALYFCTATFHSSVCKRSFNVFVFQFHKGVSNECDPSGSAGSHSVSILPFQLTICVNNSCAFAEHIHFIAQALEPALRERIARAYL